MTIQPCPKCHGARLVQRLRTHLTLAPGRAVAISPVLVVEACECGKEGGLAKPTLPARPLRPLAPLPRMVSIYPRGAMTPKVHLMSRPPVPASEVQLPRLA